MSENFREMAYASTPSGIRLPIIDLSNPRFKIADDPTYVEALRREYVAGERLRRYLPNFVRNKLLRWGVEQSILHRALLHPNAPFLDGMTTYIMKLGPENLVPPFDSKADRRLARSPTILTMRVRLQQVARMMAEALEKDLAEKPDSPLHLINIGGGSAIDSLNALILLKARFPDALRRMVTIHVLDIEDDAPHFGANALLALQREGKPLMGVDATLTYHKYTWSETGPLRMLMT